MTKLAHSLIGGAIATALLAQPIVAQAQFGGFGHKLLGGPAPAADAGPDGFVGDAMLSTKNVMIAAALLAQAVTDHTQLMGVKTYADQVNNCSDPKDLDAMRTSLDSNISTLNNRKDLSGDVTAAYNQGSAQEKKLIAVALGNLALGIYRDTLLSSRAPGVINGMGHNPMMVGKLHKVELATSLLLLQSKGLVSVGGALPKIMTAVKVAPPAMAETTKPVEVAFN